jgi:pimeloyl-ACP methyl ester carboxylesterase
MGDSVAEPNAQPAPGPDWKARRNRRLRWLAWVLVLIAAAIAIHDLRYDLRSYALLARFADPAASGPLLRFETHDVTAEDITISTPGGSLRARLFLPVGIAQPQGMVAVHGIHHLGMDEPRLMSFARAVAGTGLAVLTPQIDALADYHVDAASIAYIGESVAWLDDRLGDYKVTLTGISFAGGLSLLAASDARYASHLRALVLMGAYDDLPRVSRFLATDTEELPGGRSIPYAAHDYGASVFVYAHLAQFFPAADLPIAHEALRDWLWEQPEKALPLLDKLSPPSRATMDALLNRRINEVRPRILRAIHTDEPELEAISPNGKLASLRVPVFILHGSADNIIPPAESLWMKEDIPQGELRDVLITGAFSHVDLEKHAPVMEELRLVRFVAGVLREAN